MCKRIVVWPEVRFWGGGAAFPWVNALTLAAASPNCSYPNHYNCDWLDLAQQSRRCCSGEKMWFCLATFLLTLVLCIKNYGVRLNFDRSGFTFCTGFFHVHVHAEGDSLILRFSVLSAESSSMARPRQSTMPYQVWRSNRTATANHGGKRRRFHHDQYNNVKSRSRNN